ncbi:hypothetical protein B0A68_01990 [Flavobacterium reichenbachii]|uniref:Uncharacterized protein n=1 Tax=Flavobacterium reichenbachii TaxID=362418 RepID=A0A085ZQ75_9FLAO|nr:hypothetical protein IW19_14200 [Flavobacterium reichenbachii]OXB18806.1 hypothetical protein B0A68_01990 [Flavobacterium reichenbachii]
MFGQKQEDLTASQIVDSSLIFCGGEIRISKIESSKINYLLIQPDQTIAIINEQLNTGKKYVQCILSKSHSPQTTFFNGEKISRVDGSSITHITDVQSKEEVKLKTYNQIQYGYKQLKYQLTRLPDQKFKNFDCFVVNAKADNGYTTMNFFDKTNFRLLMIMYPNGNKSLMIDYIFKDNVLFNSHILNTISNSDKIQTLKLQTIDLNPVISNTWFNCPYTDTVMIPDYIKKGEFISTNGAHTRFTRTEIAMDYTDESGSVILKRFLAWNIISPDTFGLIDEKAFKNNDQSSSSQILVRVVSWDEKGYVCQWITDKYTDTQDYKLIK